MFIRSPELQNIHNFLFAIEHTDTRRPPVWLTFVGIVVALLAFDLGVLHKDDKEIGVRESLMLSAGYISAALIFVARVWWYLGAQCGMDYHAGFMIEKSPSMDNVSVIALIFTTASPTRARRIRAVASSIRCA